MQISANSAKSCLRTVYLAYNRIYHAGNSGSYNSFIPFVLFASMGREVGLK